MNALLDQLGIDWKLFLSQAVNFFILLVVLTFFVYKPLMKVIKQRNAKIKEGLEKAEEADVRLKEIDVIGKEKIKEAEQKGIEIIKETEDKAKIMDERIAEEKLRKSRLQMQELVTTRAFKEKRKKIKQNVLAEAAELVKKTIIKTVELKPAE